ncbi:MAG: hypothetical protein R3C10_13295 [Pirellulales bacterium]
MNASIRAEVVPVAVADFVDKVHQPSDQELTAFFEEHKDDIPDTASPQPGFRQPKMVAVEFVTATYGSFVDPDAVTAEDVKKYYDEHLEEFKSLDALTGDDEKRSG